MKVVVLTDEQVNRLKEAMVGDMAHWDMFLDMPGRPDLEGVARQEQAALRGVLTALSDTQPGVVLPLEQSIEVLSQLNAIADAGRPAPAGLTKSIALLEDLLGEATDDNG